METGREDVGVILDERRLQLAKSAALPFSSRNPHMRGTTRLLRAAIGRPPADDRPGELIAMPNEPEAVHLLDCYAMANIRSCSATVTGTSSSKGTPTMSRNCLRHMAATIEILEPTLIIVQGAKVAPDLVAELVAGRALITAYFPYDPSVDDSGTGACTRRAISAPRTPALRRTGRRTRRSCRATRGSYP
jgi:hypothetical protein